MRVAISTDGEYVSAHFGRCPAFTILDIDQGRVVGREMIENPGHQPGFIPRFLHDKGVNCIIGGAWGRGLWKSSAPWAWMRLSALPEKYRIPSFSCWKAG